MTEQDPGLYSHDDSGAEPGEEGLDLTGLHLTMPLVDALAHVGHSDHAKKPEPRPDSVGAKIYDLHHSSVATQEMDVDGHSVVIYSAAPGTVLTPLAEFSEARGKNTYTHFVDFGNLFADQGMDNSVVPINERWTEDTLPHGVDVLDFDDGVETEVYEPLNKIEGIEAKFGLNAFLDPKICLKYQRWDSEVARLQLPLNKRMKRSIEGYQGLGVVRAGVPAVEAAGFTLADMLLVNAKRHALLTAPNQIGVGLSFQPHELEQIRSQNLYIRERAIASGSSLMALLLILQANHALPKQTLLAGAVGSQRGVEQILKVRHAIHQHDLRHDTDHVINLNLGRLNYSLTGGDHSYYLVSPRNFYQVSDGGDYADLLLPPSMRSVWPGRITEGMLAQLRAEFGKKVLKGVSSEEDLTAATAVKIRDAIVAEFGKDKRWRLGEILTNSTYSMTPHYHE